MSSAGTHPKICISLGPHWLYRFGFDWFTYRRLIRNAGGRPFTVQGYHPLQSDAMEVPTFDGLLLSGGSDIKPFYYREIVKDIDPGSPRDDFELKLIASAKQRGVPILGICRGCQLLNVAFGGTLKRLDVFDLHRGAKRFCKHPVVIRRNSRMHDILRTRRLNSVRSVHREAVNELGTNVRVVARGPDGIAEAIECTNPKDEAWWCVGVQWHPELIAWGSPDRALLNSFIEASAANKT